MVVTIAFTLAILSDLYVVENRDRPSSEKCIRKTMLYQDVALGQAWSASKLALASREFPLISRPISISHHRITQIPARLYSQGEGEAGKRDGGAMMSYRDQPGKHTGHVQTHLRACATARQVRA
jgi:hypothetical protein